MTPPSRPQPPWWLAVLERIGEHYIANELSERTNLPGTGNVEHGTGTPSAGGGSDVLGLGRAVQAIVLLLIVTPFICMLCSGLSLLTGVGLVWFLPTLWRFITGG